VAPMGASAVLLFAVLLVGVGLLFHRLSGHPYPHPAHPQPPAHEAPAPALLDVSDADLDAVLARVGETFDIDREDPPPAARRARSPGSAPPRLNRRGRRRADVLNLGLRGTSHMWPRGSGGNPDR
jgi:hypothetical protein